MQKDSIFRIYSMTKPIISVATMILNEKGKFHLSEPISKYLPEFKKTQVLKKYNGSEKLYPSSEFYKNS